MFEGKRDLINMYVYISYMCVCVHLNVDSPFDQEVSLPNVMVGENRGGGGSYCRPWDQSHQLCTYKKKKKLHFTPEGSSAQ